MNKWLVLELNSRSEGEDPELIAQSIRNTIRGAEVFLPASTTRVGGDSVVQYLVDGYAFVRLDRAEQDYLVLEGGKYVQSILASYGVGRSRKLSFVTDREINKFRSQLKSEVDQGIGVGDEVVIASGPYSNIPAMVIDDVLSKDEVQVIVRLRSKECLLTYPRSALKLIERSSLAPIQGKIDRLGVWVSNFNTVAKWDVRRIDSVLTSWLRHEQVSSLAKKYSDCHGLITLCTGDLDSRLCELTRSENRVSSLDRWCTVGRPLYDLAGWDEGSLDTLSFEVVDKARAFDWLDSVYERLHALSEDIRVINRELVGGNVVQNLVVDGHNLARRCYHAPGLGELTDGSGHLTGVALGFCNSLVSLKKQFPECTIHVVWDGSSRRRKDKYAEYKAGRTPAPEGLTDVVRALLPSLGVTQYCNEGEEADDVIATLVRGAFKDQQNVILSNDTDLLQLVTENTMVLKPGAGTRKDILFDRARVRETFGVWPERMLDYRAMCGDDSDNIPGIPRVPKRVLCALVNNHGSVRDVFKSSLVGLSRAQYDKLRSTEPQVFINLELMALQNVEYSVIRQEADLTAATQLLQSYKIKPDSIVDVLVPAA